MKNFVLHKTTRTSEDNFLFFSGVIAIILAVKTKEYAVFLPFIFLITINVIVKAILFFKWQYSYALKLTQEHIIINHTILYNKITIPLLSINGLNREQRYVELKENSDIKIPRLIKSKKNQNKVYFSTLSDYEINKLFDRMEDFGIVSL